MIKITKILAEGTNKSYMTIEINDYKKTIFIDRKTYYKLKEEGIPTAQALSRRKQK